MRIQRVQISNFRSFENLDLSLDGRSVFLIGENAGGKTALLTAIARGLGRDLSFRLPDFRDPSVPIEITVTVDGLSLAQRKLLADHAEFPPGKAPRLQSLARAVWDDHQEEAEVEHLFAKHLRRSRRDERESIAPLWLPAERDAARLLQFGVPRNLMGRLVEELPIEPTLDRAIADIQKAAEQLSEDSTIKQFLAEARDRLDSLVPDVGVRPYTMGLAANTGHDLLRQFELMVEHLGQSISIGQQSSGVAQISVFVFALALGAADMGAVLLVDEPEISLHPQAQRALVHELRMLDAQTLVATHSPNLLERVDARHVVRMKRVAGKVEAVSPTHLIDEEAERLRRFTNPYAAEAFFARAVLLVEGDSDRVALEAVAQRLGRNLDADGVTIVPINGASKAPTYIDLFGPRGFEIKVGGLFDAAELKYYASGVERAGLATSPAVSDLEGLGFLMCDEDLEDELIRAAGARAVVAAIDANGDTNDFKKFQNQPAHAQKTLEEQLRGFVQAGRSSRKVEYAPLLVDAIATSNLPRPLTEVLKTV